MKKDHLRYYWSNFAKAMQNLILKFITAVSFLAILFLLMYVLYYLFVVFSSTKVITGCIALCVMVHLNKSI